MTINTDLLNMGLSNRKHPHRARFHTADYPRSSVKEQRDRTPTHRRAHGIWSDVRTLTPKEQAALNKRLKAGTYANSYRKPRA